MLNFLATLICFIVFIFILILVVIPLCILEIYKQLLRIWLSIKHGRIIEMTSGFVTITKIGDRKHLMQGTLVLHFHGTLDLQWIKNRAKTKWTNAMTNGKYTHPKFRQYVERSSGYFYWKFEKNFSVEDHVQLYNCKPPKNKDELHQINSEIASIVLPNNKSPWVIIAYPLDECYYNQPGYAILVKLHHCLADGYNFIRLTNMCFFNEKDTKYLQPPPSKSFSYFTILSNFFQYPKYLLTEQLLAKDFNIFHGPEQTGHRFFRESPIIRLERVKKIRMAIGATVNDIMISCVSGALSRLYKNRKAPPLNDVRAAIAASLQNPKSPIQLINNVIYFFIRLPVQDISEIDRLKCIQKISTELKKTQLFYFDFILVGQVLCRLPAFVNELLVKMYSLTLFCTNIPLQLNQSFTEKGDEFYDSSGYVTHHLKVALGIGIGSYNGKIKLSLSADSSVFDENDADNFIKFFNETLDELEKESKV